MRFRRNSLISPVFLVLLLMLILGAVAGQLVGKGLRILEEERHMDIYMTALRDYSSRLLASARNTLEAANNSPFEICSPQDLAYQRKLVFAAYHIKDIGRLRDDQLICSTLLSDIKTQPRRSVANDNLKDGTYIYADDALITPGSHGPIIGRGNANVVLSSVAFDLLHTPRYAFSIFATDEEKKHFALLYNYSGNAEPGPEPSSGDWAQKFVEAPDGKVLRENSCDPDTGVCISLSATIDRTSTAARLKNLLAICLGALAGGSVGLGWLYYRNRDHSLLYRLNKALAAGEPHLLYQPVVDMADGKVLGFEALIRWEIRKGDFVPPDVFVARAEEAGTATKITIYVLERLIEDMGDTLRQRRDLRININITASDLQSPAFMSRMERRLAAADIEPQQVGLELTERTAVDFSKATDGIRRLREQGHRIYIDDFGTGYSSLAYLGELHVDAIKIDKAFTRTVGNDYATVSIIPQIISMAKEHGLDIVVEGVETEAQVLYFRKLGTPLATQGWFFGKPLCVSDAQALVATVKKKQSRVKLARKTTQKAK